MSPIHVGILLNSALYLFSCFVAGLLVHNGVAWRFAIAAMGLTYVGYLCQWHEVSRGAMQGVVAASIIAGAASGFSLLF